MGMHFVTLEFADKERDMGSCTIPFCICILPTGLDMLYRSGAYTYWSIYILDNSATRYG